MNTKTTIYPKKSSYSANHFSPLMLYPFLKGGHSFITTFSKEKRIFIRIKLSIICAATITVSSCYRPSKYDWIPTECAPKNYPVRIFSGSFFYGNNKSISIPNGRFVNYGWGEEGSTELVGEKLKESPDKFEITWLSYTENKTYTGNFELNKEKIDNLFQKGYDSGNSTDSMDTFDEIKVGMAPGGLIVVWLSAPGGQVEVGNYKAHSVTNVDWKKELPNLHSSMNEYVAIIIADLPEEIQLQSRNNSIPFERWEKWRRRFSWNTVVSKDCLPEKVFVEYFNAEKTLNTANQKLQPTIDLLAAPKRMYVVWKYVKNQARRTDINFDEGEVINAFSQIKDGEKAELDIHINPNNGEAIVKLKTKDKEITLAKTKTNSVILN